MEETKSSHDADGTRLQRPSGDHDTAYGLDRYSWQQGENAKFGFQITENSEPALVAKGGGSGLLLYQEEIGSLCATDYKWIQQQQVMENKLIICKR